MLTNDAGSVTVNSGSQNSIEVQTTRYCSFGGNIKAWLYCRERGHRTRYDVEGVGDAHGVKTFLFPALSDRRVFSHVTDLHNLLLLYHVSRQLPDLLRF